MKQTRNNKWKIFRHVKLILYSIYKVGGGFKNFCMLGKLLSDAVLPKIRWIQYKKKLRIKEAYKFSRRAIHHLALPSYVYHGLMSVIGISVFGGACHLVYL